MKFLYATTVAALAMIASGPAVGAVYSVGGPLASTCYSSALNHIKDRSAIEACTRALTEEALSDADRAATLINRGIVRTQRGEMPTADADFDAAIAINSQLAEAYLNKGYLRLRSGGGKEALPLIQQGLDLGAGTAAIAWFARGVAYEQLGDYKSAYSDLKKAQSLAPGWSMPAEYLADYRVGR